MPAVLGDVTSSLIVVFQDTWVYCDEVNRPLLFWLLLTV